MPPDGPIAAQSAAGPIALSEPALSGREWELVKDCLDSGWVSSVGPYVTRFEREVAILAECHHGVAMINGSAALHMALLTAGVGPGDEVVLPTISFVASANAVRYCGGRPLLVDIEPDFLQLDVDKLHTFLQGSCTRLADGQVINGVTGRRVAAIMPVHLLGHPVALADLLTVADTYGLPVIEDAAQALGSRYLDRPVGGWGRSGCFSFNGNKIVTSGGGGVLVTNDEAVATRARHLSTQARSPGPGYRHDEVGYNYRLTNLQAALGCAQLQSLAQRVIERREIADHYARALADQPGISPIGEAAGASSNAWLPAVIVDEREFGCSQELLRQALSECSIESRSLYEPLHRSRAVACEVALPTEVADRLHTQALCLPTGLGAGSDDQMRVVDAIVRTGEQARAQVPRRRAAVTPVRAAEHPDDQPALLGGTPVRSKPFPTSVWLDGDERQAIVEALERREFSHCAGGAVPNVESHLRLTSAAAVDHPLPYWNVLGGETVRRLERDVAASVGVPFAVAVNSATTGLVAALQAAGVGPGDEVITTPVTFTATATSIVLANAVPIFADVDKATGNLEPSAVAAQISPRTRAILLVHLLGRPADMDAFTELADTHGIALIEDCAQAPGANHRGRPVGGLGRFGVYSLQQTKNVMAGEGGLVVARCPQDARKLRLARSHGEAIVSDSTPDDDVANTFGSNYRMTELTAALARVQWGKLESSNRLRSRNAAYLRDRLTALEGLSMPPDVEHARNIPHVLALQYDADVARVPKPLMLDALRAEGIPVSGGYPKPLYMQRMFQSKQAYGKAGCPFRCPLYDLTPDYRAGSCPQAEAFLERALWIFQIYPPLGQRDMDDIMVAFERVWSARKRLHIGGH